MSEKWIALIGDPNTGFAVCGPFASAEDIDEAPVEATYYAPTGYWSVPLKKPSVEDANNLDVPLPDDAGYDPNGTAVSLVATSQVIGMTNSGVRSVTSRLHSSIARPATASESTVPSNSSPCR
jgi:hypothetical protein